MTYLVFPAGVYFFIMIFCMFASCHYFKIFYSVINFITVDMVYYFKRFYLSADMFFHYLFMQINLFFAKAYIPVLKPASFPTRVFIPLKIWPCFAVPWTMFRGNMVSKVFNSYFSIIFQRTMEATKFLGFFIFSKFLFTIQTKWFVHRISISNILVVSV